MRKPAMGFRGMGFSAKSSPHEDVQGEKGRARREVTKMKIHLTCRTDDTEALFALIHSDSISYRAKPAYNYAQPEQQSAHMGNATRLERAGLYLPTGRQIIHKSIFPCPSL